MARTSRSSTVVMRTREAILDGAMVVFSRQGYHAVTVKDIAAAAGYTAPSLYNYFGGKEEIFAALLERIHGVFLAIFDEPVPSGLLFRQRLELMIRRHIDERRRHTDAFGLFMKMLNTAMPTEELAQWRAEAFATYLDRLTRWITEAVGEEDLAVHEPRTLAFHLFGTMIGEHARVLLGGDEEEADPQAQTERIVSLFTNGIRGGGA